MHLELKSCLHSGPVRTALIKQYNYSASGRTSLYAYKLVYVPSYRIDLNVVIIS